MDIIVATSYIFLMLFLIYISNRRKIIGFWIRKQKFRCTNCGYCCRLIVRLTLNDINHIKKAGYKDDYFIENRGKEKWLKNINGYCRFLSINNGKSRCKIYPYRPEVCRSFPRRATFFGIEGNDPRCNSFKTTI